MNIQPTQYHKILTIINPVSGAGGNDELWPEIKQHFDQQSQTFLFETTGENDKESLEEAIATHDPDLLCVAGGDGTIKLAASALKDKAIPITIIPRGSANGLATDLELPDDLETALKSASSGKTRAVDAVAINGHVCLHISDFGINAELIKNFDDGSVRGKLGYLLQSMPTVLQTDAPYAFTIEIDGEVLQREAIMIAVANSQKFGTGANINPQGKIDDGVFEVLVFKEFDLPKVLKTFYGEIEMNTDFVEYFPSTQARISSDAAVDFQIDGEYIGAKNTIEACIKKQMLTIAVP